MIAPGLRDHHEDRVREGPSRQHQELQHVVKACGIALVFPDDREELVEVVAKQVRLAERLSGAHPVDVAP